MPGWPGGLGNRLQDGRAVVDQGLGDKLQDVWNYLKSESSIARMADPRTSPFGPAAIARLFADPAGEAGRQVETGRQLAEPFTQFNDPRVDPVKQGADLALTAGGGGLATVEMRPAGSAGIFGGRLAKTANIERLTRATDMANGGFTPEEIWKETGWFKGADDKWKFEIPDDASRVTAKTIDALTQREWRGSKAGPAGEILEHPELYKAYPELQNIDTYVDYGVNYPSSSGRYDKGWPGDAKYFGRSPQINMELNALAGPEGPRSIMLHELQHPIQDIEGFAKGGSPDDFGGFGGYRRLAGEVEARNVQGRRRMTDEQRRAIPPWVTQDTPIEQQHMRFGGSGPQASIKAYHGSPHDFERFDASRIGTGEGAQAYGHGLYFAEREGVAKEYRDSLSQNQKKWLVDGKHVGTYGENSTPLGSAAANIRGVKGSDGIVTAEDAAKAIEHFEGVHQRNKGMLPKEHIAETVKEMRGLVGRNVSEDASGKMYEVDIAADPEHFLDWDKPLSEQPQTVQDAVLAETKVRPLAGDPPLEQVMRMNPDTLLRHGLSEGRLRQGGVPGIRYLDQGSRGLADVNNMRGTVSMLEVAARKNPNDANLHAQLANVRKQLADAEKGLTRNYVVFSDDLIKILRKYGIPIGALGATGAALSGKKEQPPGL